MKRREFITLLGGAAIAWPLPARAQQQPTHVPQVGWIFPGASAGHPTELAGFKEGLRELGYVEGRNIVVEYRFGEDSVERLPEFATELAQINVSVIVAVGTSAVRAARHAAPEIPIVFLSADPIGAGIVTNLSRPGGNVSGVSVMRLSGKWPELAKEALPGLSRVGYLINPTNPASVNAAHPYPTNWPQVAGLALGHKLPAISEIREFVLAGGLMSYGVRLFDLTRRMAHYVDRILRGTKVGDLPVEQPTKFELVINLRTAKALGLTIPPTLLARADEVIE